MVLVCWALFLFVLVLWPLVGVTGRLICCCWVILLCWWPWKTTGDLLRLLERCLFLEAIVEALAVEPWCCYLSEIWLLLFAKLEVAVELGGC